MTLREIANELLNKLRCNCDLDKWQPEPSTGHTCVCRIHTTAVQKMIADTYKQELKTKVVCKICGGDCGQCGGPCT